MGDGRREKGTGNGERGTGNGERGTGNGERECRSTSSRAKRGTYYPDPGAKDGHLFTVHCSPFARVLFPSPVSRLPSPFSRIEEA